VTAGRYQPQTPEPDSCSEVESTESVQVGEDLPLSKWMYHLLDLITEKGSSGLGNPVLQISYTYAHRILVDKIVVIAQQSLPEFINALSPGVYSSITKNKDNVVLKPSSLRRGRRRVMTRVVVVAVAAAAFIITIATTVFVIAIAATVFVFVAATAVFVTSSSRLSPRHRRDRRRYRSSSSWSPRVGQMQMGQR
jgi:hypothetical protein